MIGGWGALVGREREQALVHEVLDAAVAGRGRVVLVTGEAGIGKTALCNDVASRAASAVDIASVTCWEGGDAPAFWLWTTLLDGLGEKLDLQADGHADPRAARVALFDGVVATLAAHARERPALLTIDDLQWADEPSVALLRFLAPRLRTMPVAVLAAVRTGEPFAGPVTEGVVVELARHGLSVPLGGLDRAALAAVVRDVTGEAPNDAALNDLLERTNGNPLFARELATAPGDAELPAAVRLLLGRRLDGLDESSAAVLDAAAILGDDASVDVLAAVLEVAADAVLAAVDLLSGRRLVEITGPGLVRLAHPLLRALALERMRVARRVRWHERVAVALERLRDAGRPVATATLAGHFCAAAPAGSAEPAVRYAAAAGEEAMRALAYEQAARHFEQACEALDLAPSAADRGHLLQRRGDALLASGRGSEARAVYIAAATAARSAGDAVRFAEAALAVGSGGGFEVRLFDAEQIALLDEAVALVADTEPALRARLLARRSVAESFVAPLARRLPAAQEALALARAARDSAATCDALAALCDACAGPAESERRIELADELIRLAVDAGDLDRELLGRRLLVVAHWERGDLAAVDAEIERYAATATRLRLPLYGWYVPLWRSARCWMSGDDATAGRLLEQAEALGAAADSRNADVLVMTARYFRAADLGDPLELTPDDLPPESMHSTAVSVAYAYALSAAGRLAEARSSLDGAASALPDLPDDSEWLPSMAQAAWVAHALGGHPLAPHLYDALLPHRGRFVVEGIGAHCHGPVERHLALLATVLGRGDDAAAHREAARSAAVGVGASRVVEQIDAEAGDVGPQPAAAGVLDAVLDGEFRRDGDGWLAGLGGRRAHVRDSKGVRDIAALLARPGRELAALDLAGVGRPADSDLGPAIDAAARAAYRRRLAELEDEVADADAAADLVRGEQARAERDALVGQLAGAYGLGGRARPQGDPAERARTAVTARIKDAVRRIDRLDPELARHLRRSLRTGTFCTYDPVTPVRWRL